jgi:transcription elongation GreA/GreB family factor
MKKSQKEAQSNSNMLRVKILSDLKEASRILSNLPNGTAEAKEATAHIDAAIRLIEG